jgi:hypothetical protein
MTILNKIWRKFVRKDAPQTSVEAAQSISPNPMELIVLEVIKGFPDGCISDQVQDALPHMAYSSVTARFSGLFRKGLIIYSGETRKGRSGRGQRVMKAV